MSTYVTPASLTPAPASRQRGAVLFVSLIFLVVLTLLGVMLARTQTTEERMAQNDANHDLALESAGAALRFAEMSLSEGIYTDFSQDSAGLYTLDPTVGSVYPSQINWSTASDVLTGPTLTSVSAAPEFIVEQLPAAPIPGAPLGGCTGYGGNGCVSVYQITSYSVGGNQTGSATLRSIYEVD